MITTDLATFALKNNITSAMSRRKSPEQVPGGEDAKIDEEEPTNEEIKMDDSPNQSAKREKENEAELNDAVTPMSRN